LNDGFSTRQIDKALGENPIKSKGWISFKVLKKYKLLLKDKGKLFLHNQTEAKKIVSEILNSKNYSYKLEALISKHPPASIAKYKNIFIVADDAEKFYIAAEGLVRNLTHKFFSQKKKKIGICQYCEKKMELDTAHIGDERPVILKKSANSLKFKQNGQLYFPLENILKSYLLEHQKPKSIAFLCKNHHLMQENLKKGKDKISYRNFLNKIFS
jgi:hypothetical protein